MSISLYQKPWRPEVIQKGQKFSKISGFRTIKIKQNIHFDTRGLEISEIPYYHTYTTISLPPYYIHYHTVRLLFLCTCVTSYNHRDKMSQMFYIRLYDYMMWQLDDKLDSCFDIPKTQYHNLFHLIIDPCFTFFREKMTKTLCEP